MKIDLQSKLNYYTPPVKEFGQKSGESATTSKPSGNYDGITIQTGQMPSKEDMFASSTASRLSMELRKPANPAHVLDLQQQVDEGRYQVDVNTIADRIMLY